MNINSIFYTIQGEGIGTGKPSIFLRLSGCNLQCIWCDTKYTWLFTEKTLVKLQLLGSFKETTFFNKNKESKSFTINEIMSEFSKYPTKHVVITGGEPLLQSVELIEMMHLLPGYSFEIETNGTKSPLNVESDIIYNVSPKLSNAKNDSPTIISSVIQEFKTKNSYFKFVIEKLEDLSEVKKIVLDNEINSDQVLLMPQARSQEELNEKSTWLIEECKKLGYRYSYRLHVQIWGDKREV